MAMIKKELEIINKVGLHARPAAMFVQMANKYTSDVYVEKDSKKVNGKSIMGIMSLGVARGEKIVIITDGPDEEEAMEGITNLIEKTLKDF